MYKKGQSGKKFRDKDGKERGAKGDVSSVRSFSGDSATLDCHQTGPNDWRWYAVNEGLLRDSASFPYGWPLGNPVDLGPEINSAYYLGGAIPGVMSLEIMPTIGYSRNSSSPINVAARNIYSYVRHANSGHANYDSTDLMLYLIAMDSAYSMFSFMRRIYGVMRAYTATNRYYPKGLLASMHVNFDSIQANLAQLRYFINTYAVKIGSMCVPASMSYHARHMWMYDGLYVDSVSDKAQTYLYTPNGFYQFQLDSQGAGMLSYTQIHEYYPSGGTELDFNGLVTWANDIINPLLADEDMNIMSGDILKAYGAGGIVKVQGISADYLVLPVYSEEVLNQIANSTAVGYPYTKTTLANDPKVRPNCDIWQDVSSIPDSPNLRAYPSTQTFASTEVTNSIQNVVIGGWTSTLGGGNVTPLENLQRLVTPFTAKRIVTFQHGSIEPKDTMVATRLTNMAKWEDWVVAENAPLPEMAITTVASEMVIVYNIAKFTSNGILRLYTTTSAAIITFLPGSGVPEGQIPTMDSAYGLELDDAPQHIDSWMVRGLTTFGNMLANFSVFDWHPLLYPQYITGSAYKSTPGTGSLDSFKLFKVTDFAPPLGDINYYTVLGRHDLERLTETALLSEFSVPQAGFTLSGT